MRINANEELFLELQNYIARNLTEEKRRKYQKEIQNKKTLEEKIECAKLWRVIAEQEYILRWIKEYFPRDYISVKKRCDNLDKLNDNDEKAYFLQNRFSYFKKLYEKKIETQYINLKNKILEKVSQKEIYFIEENLEDLSTIQEKIRYLENLNI